MDFDSGPSAHQVFQEAFEEQQRQPVNGRVVDGERKMLYVPSFNSVVCRSFLRRRVSCSSRVLTLNPRYILPFHAPPPPSIRRSIHLSLHPPKSNPLFHHPSTPPRDLVFVQDCTGSQGSYISSATKNIELICENIFESGKLQSREDLRVGLVAYRDHPPQDHSYVTKNFGFSSDISKVHRDLSSLYASGGGDGPEAVTAGLMEALGMEWRPEASKMIVLIADAPPHGIGEYGDGEFFFLFECGCGVRGC